MKIIPTWMKTKKFIIPSGLVFLLAVVVLANSRQQADQGLVEGQKIRSVQVQPVEPTNQLNTELILSGTIVPREFIRLRSLVAADLAYLEPVGRSVVQGQTVAGLADGRIEDNYLNASQSISDAQNNLLQTQALNLETVNQADLTVESAAANKQLAEAELTNARQLADQQLKAASNNARVAYQSAYNLIEQVLRFWSDGALAKFNLQNALVANFELQQTAVQQFDFLVIDFKQISPAPGSDYVVALTGLNPALEATKVFNDSVFRLLNFMVSGNNFTESMIESMKLQAVNFISQLNAQLTTLNNNLNALESARVTSQASVTAAENRLKQTQIQLANAQAAQKSAKTQAEIRELGARSQVTSQRSALTAAGSQFDNLNVRAPFNGIIIAHLADLGDQISPGDPLLEIGDISGVEIELAIDERSGDLIQVGQTVLINNSVTGVIDEINTTADLETGKIPLTVVAEQNVSLKPGAAAKVKLQLSYKLPDMILVPLANVTVAQNENYVLVAQGQESATGEPAEAQSHRYVVTKRTVRLGQVYDSYVEVIEGLAAGDLLILDSGDFLGVGEAVEINQ